MKHLLSALAGATLLSACSSNTTGVLMHSDFESAQGWTGEAATRTTEQAHSGRYSLKVDPTHPYSLTYYSLLGKLIPYRIRGVRVEAWAYTPNAANSSRVQLSISLNDAVGGNMLLGEGIPFDKAVSVTGKWTKISKDFIFPPKANYNSQLVIYLWNGGSDSAGPAYLDDIQLIGLD